MRRWRAVVEGSFDDAENNHSYKRSRWRGLERMIIQNLLIATIQNIRKLIKVNSFKISVSMAKSVHSVLNSATCTILNRYLYFRRAKIENLSEY